MSPSKATPSRGVMVIVVGDDDRFLLHHRDDKPGVLYPGHWAGFGGAVEAGEGPEEALIREMEEETGVRLNPGEARVIGEIVDPEAAGRLVTLYLLERSIAAEDIELGEGQGFGYFSADEIAALTITPFVRRAITDEISPLLAARRRSPARDLGPGGASQMPERS